MTQFFKRNIFPLYVAAVIGLALIFGLWEGMP